MLEKGIMIDWVAGQHKNPVSLEYLQNLDRDRDSYEDKEKPRVEEQSTRPDLRR